MSVVRHRVQRQAPACLRPRRTPPSETFAVHNRHEKLRYSNLGSLLSKLGDRWNRRKRERAPLLPGGLPGIVEAMFLYYQMLAEISKSVKSLDARIWLRREP